MSKLDWSKAGRVSSDPGRVVDVGDYGILPDRHSAPKGRAKVKRKAKGKAPKPANTSMLDPAVSSKSKRYGNGGRSTKKKNVAEKLPRGLTIPEMISRAKIKVDRIASEIAREERKLANMREQLKSAERQLRLTQDAPRRSVAGKASHEAQRRENRLNGNAPEKILGPNSKSAKP